MPEPHSSQPTARTRFRRFYTTARRYWEDGRHAGVQATRKRCFASAADRHGLPAELFERLYERCFEDRPDRFEELSAHLQAARLDRRGA